MGFLSGAAAVVGNVAGGLLQGYQNRKAAQKANKYNYTAWQLQNEYNTPKEQRERLEEAGYNPNLWYTQGNTGNAGTLATSGYQAADWQGMTNRALSGLAQYQQVQATQANIKNTNANTELAKYNASNADLQGQILQHNLTYAQNHNLPVGQTESVSKAVGEGIGPVIRGVGNTARGLWDNLTSGQFFNDWKDFGKSLKFNNGNLRRAREAKGKR